MNTEAKSLKVLVYGATGSQAAPIIDKLITRGHQPVGVTHRAENLQALTARGAEAVVADMADKARLVEISKGMDAIALLVPFMIQSDPFEAGKNAIDAAKEAGVSMIVWNTSGVILPGRVGKSSYDARIDIRDYLQKSGIPHVILQPTVYVENLLGPWTVPFVQEKDQVAYPIPADFTLSFLPSQDMASLIVAALEKPGLNGSSFIVSGTEQYNGEGLAASFSAALGRKISYYPMPPQEFGNILNQAFGAGAGDEAAQTYEALWRGEVLVPFYVDMQPVLEKLPVQMTSIGDWVQQFSKAFSKA